MPSFINLTFINILFKRMFISTKIVPDMSCKIYHINIKILTQKKAHIRGETSGKITIL